MDTQHESQQPEAASIREAARLLYETTPDTTLDSVAKEVGVSVRTVKRWSAADGHWRKAGGPVVTAKAHQAADRIAKAVEQAGPDPSEADKRAAADAARLEASVDERAKVLDRHRSEWGIVRGLVGEAVRSRDGAKAKMAVDVGRALKLAQDGERRAWGLDIGDVDQGAVIVEIERE